MGQTWGARPAPGPQLTALKGGIQMSDPRYCLKESKPMPDDQRPSGKASALCWAGTVSQEEWRPSPRRPAMRRPHVHRTRLVNGTDFSHLGNQTLGRRLDSSSPKTHQGLGPRPSPAGPLRPPLQSRVATEMPQAPRKIPQLGNFKLRTTSKYPSEITFC